MLLKIDLFCATTSLERRAKFINQKWANVYLYCVRSIYWQQSKSYENILCSGFWDDTKVRTASLLSNLWITRSFILQCAIDLSSKKGMHTFGVSVNQYGINWDLLYSSICSANAEYALIRCTMVSLPLSSSLPVSGYTSQQCLRKIVVSRMPLEQFTLHR